MVSRRVTRTMVIGRLWFCLMVVTLFSSSYSLMAQGTDLLDISAGGTASGSYVADEDFSGGATANTVATINTSGVTNPAPQAVYQHQRYGNFTYTIPGFTSGATYLVRLHFDEFYWTAAGKRVFNVLINGAQVLANFDIFAAAGGENIATVKQFNAVANSSGQIVIQFVPVVDNAEINGIEIESAGAAEAPYGGTPAAVPGTVQAENYDTGGQGVAYNVTSTNGSANSYRTDGVDLEVTTDTGGGYDLGWTTAGQWFKYTVKVATAGTYTVTFRVATPNAVTDAFHIANSGGANLSGPVNLPATGGYQAWENVTATVTLPAGVQTLAVYQDTAGWNINWLSFAASSSNTEAPYGGTPAVVPGAVQAENYDTGGQGVAYNVTSTNGSANSYRTDGIDLELTTDTGGGYDVGWTTAGQWFKYTVNVATAGTYTVTFRIAAPGAVTDAFHLSNSSGTNLSGSVNVAATGGYQVWENVTATVTLPAGTQTLTLNQDGAGWNVNWFSFAAGSGGGTGSCSGVTNISVGGTTYTPQWCQEFNGGVGSAIDTTVWNFDLGNGGFGNGEAETYCGPPGYPGNPSQCPTSFSTSTAPVYIDGNGHLVIQPIFENGTWLSGRMNTGGKQNFTYGVLVANIELPDTTNQGLWPAFWTLGSDIATVPWPGCGEADILENWSPQVFGGAGTAGNNSTIHTSVTGGNGIGRRFTFPGGEATNTAFHTYGIVWTANQMQFFVDNPSAPFFTATPSILPSGDTWPFNQQLFTILNVAVGGTLGGSINGLSNPGSMKVDYVRWYTAQ